MIVFEPDGILWTNPMAINYQMVNGSVVTNAVATGTVGNVLVAGAMDSSLYARSFIDSVIVVLLGESNYYFSYEKMLIFEVPPDVRR